MTDKEHDIEQWREVVRMARQQVAECQTADPRIGNAIWLLDKLDDEIQYSITNQI